MYLAQIVDSVWGSYVGSYEECVTTISDLQEQISPPSIVVSQ